MYQPRGCTDTVVSLFMSLALFCLALSVLLMLVAVFAAAVALGLFLRFVVRHYVLPQLYPATAVFAQKRLFGAPPDSQWFSAFDYWLLCLEKATGLTFTQSPGQLLVGAIIISLAPALVIGLPLSLVTGGASLVGLGIAGLLTGAVTGHRLGQSAQGWFDGVGSPSMSSDMDTGGFGLGEEEW